MTRRAHDCEGPSWQGKRPEGPIARPKRPEGPMARSKELEGPMASRARPERVLGHPGQTALTIGAGGHEQMIAVRGSLAAGRCRGVASTSKSHSTTSGFGFVLWDKDAVLSLNDKVGRNCYINIDSRS